MAFVWSLKNDTGWEEGTKCHPGTALVSEMPEKVRCLVSFLKRNWVFLLLCAAVYGTIVSPSAA